jgi:hypothetical protein
MLAHFYPVPFTLAFWMLESALTSVAFSERQMSVNSQNADHEMKLLFTSFARY